jgi:uncharacterized protein (DUF1015 family)
MKDAIIYAGYSRLADGTMKFRTATTQKRVDQLVALGEEVHMRIINDVHSKSDAAKELLRLDHANGAKELEKFYAAQVRDENPFKKTTRLVKVKVPNKAMVHLVGAKVEVEKMSAKEAAKIRAEFNAKVKAAYEAN